MDIRAWWKTDGELCSEPDGRKARCLRKFIFSHPRKTEERLGPFQSEVARLCTIPGVDRVTAWRLLAEIALNMSQFCDAQHLANWAGLCPAAGKCKSGEIRKGSLWLRRCLCQAAWAVSTKKNNDLSALYRRLAARRGSKRATIAIAQSFGHRVLHSARPDLLPRPRPRLL